MTVKRCNAGGGVWSRCYSDKCHVPSWAVRLCGWLYHNQIRVAPGHGVLQLVDAHWDAVENEPLVSAGCVLVVAGGSVLDVPQESNSPLEEWDGELIPVCLLWVFTVIHKPLKPRHSHLLGWVAYEAVEQQRNERLFGRFRCDDFLLAIVVCFHGFVIGCYL